MKKFSRYLFILGSTVFLGHTGLARADIYTSSGSDIVTPKSFTQTTDNKINGEVPPGKIGVSSRKMLLNETIDGITHMVMKISRLPGYRSPVHYHHNSPVSCVLAGQTTFYLEGYKPRVITAGHCFYMPANTKGANYNSGKTSMTLLDFMVLPKGMPSWVLLEKAPNYSVNDM